MTAKGDYAVGKGKPPKHTQFRKGQSGNPGGRPGATKSFRQLLENEIAYALTKKTSTLYLGGGDNAFESIVYRLVVDAANGVAPARKAFFDLVKQFDWDGGGATRVRPSPPTRSGGDAEALTQPPSLSQGKSQGSGEDSHPANPISQLEQEVGPTVEMCSGKLSGNTQPPPPPPQPRRCTITVGGRIVQQGD